jgi:predicted permease
MYYLVQSLLFWSFGAYGLSRDGPVLARLTGGPQADVTVPNVFSLATVKDLLSPPLIGSVVAILLILSDLKLPTFLNQTFNYLGSMTTPLAILFIGIAIYLANLRHVRITLDMGVLIAARFLIAPAGMLVACAIYPVPDLMRKVFIIEAAMPVMTQISIASLSFKADANYVAVMTALTTVISLITIPVYFVLLTYNVI